MRCMIFVGGWFQFCFHWLKKIISENLKEAPVDQYILKGFAEIQLFIFKHLPTEIDLSFHLLLLLIPSVSKITQRTEWTEWSLQSYLELYLGNLFSRKI